MCYRWGFELWGECILARVKLLYNTSLLARPLVQPFLCPTLTASKLMILWIAHSILLVSYLDHLHCPSIDRKHFNPNRRQHFQRGPRIFGATSWLRGCCG
jgi:hypothetical protein